MKKIKISFLLFIPVLLLFFACERAPEPGGPVGDEATVEMRFSAPMTYAMPRAVDPEDALLNMQVLVFDGSGDNARFLYRRTAIKKSGSDNMFRATLVVADNVTLRFAANANSIIASATDVLVEGKTWGEIREKLIMTHSENIAVATGLPMWGEAVDINIVNKEINTLGTVAMLRSISSAEVKILPNIDEFQLEEVWLVYAADKGYLPYNPAFLSGNGTDLEAVKPYSPGTFRNAADIKIGWVSTGAKEVKNIYMFDNAAALYTIGEVKPTRIILKGTWKKGEAGAHPTYYPLTFRDADAAANNQKLQVTRNWKYIIQITQVHGDGFESLEDAKKAEDINIDYDVIPWEVNGDTEIIISENKWVSLKSRLIYFPKSLGFRFRVGFSSNYYREDMYIWDKDLNAYNRDDGKTGVIIYDDNGDPFCQVLIVKQSGLSGNRFDFNFELLRDYSSATSHTAKMKVKIGRITFELNLEQLDKNWGDWEDGGEIGWG